MSAINCAECVGLSCLGITQGYFNIVLNGFAFNVSPEHAKKRIPVRLEDFYLSNDWSNKELKPGSFTEYNLIDASTNNRYFEDLPTPDSTSSAESIIRLKCKLLFLSAFTLTPLALILNVANRIVKIVTFSHFWFRSDESATFKIRLKELGRDLLIIVATPLLWVGMIFASAYGIFKSPYDGRKLYATFERAAYSGGYQPLGLQKPLLQTRFLADCFQPRPPSTRHAEELLAGVQGWLAAEKEVTEVEAQAAVARAKALVDENVLHQHEDLLDKIVEACANVLFNGFTFTLSQERQGKETGIKREHFHRCHNWSQFGDYGYTIDSCTDDLYFQEEESILRKQCQMLFFATLLLQPVGLGLNLLNRTVKVLMLHPLGAVLDYCRPTEKSVSLKVRSIEAGKDLLIIVYTPMLFVGMLLASLYGATYCPNNGRKFYATLERLAYSGGHPTFCSHALIPQEEVQKLRKQKAFLAPDFQPRTYRDLGIT